jgi:peroxiredoxin family protein
MAAVTVQKERAPEREVAQSKVCIVLSKGSLDMVYPAFMIGNTAATMGSEVHIFFTFWGLSVLNKKKVGSLKISPVGNPGLPMPNILGMIPGMTRVTTGMMKGRMKKINMPTIQEMITTAKDLGVHLHACSTTMSMDIIGFPKEDLIPEAEDIIGAATFLELSQGATTLFI